MYDSIEETSSRLASTVVMYDGAPVLVDSVSYDTDRHGSIRSHEIALRVHRIGGVRKPKTKQILLRDNKLEYMRIPLGYINWQIRAIYLSRKPSRTYKQGLYSENVHISSDLGVQQSLSHSRPQFIGTTPDWTQVMRTPGFRSMMANNYPTCRAALKKLQGTKSKESLAFGRKLCLLKDPIGLVYVLYKGERIGWAGDDGMFILGQKYEYLTEVLESNGVEVR